MYIFFAKKYYVNSVQELTIFQRKSSKLMKISRKINTLQQN